VSPDGFEPWEWTFSQSSGAQRQTVTLTAENAWTEMDPTGALTLLKNDKF